MDLLEREQCFVKLTAWLSAARARGGCVALVGGEAGIGKTALIQEFARCHHEMRVLWGACDALFTPEPLAPLHDIARQTQGALLTAVTSGANRDAIFSAVLDEVEHANALWRLRKFGRYGRFSPRLRGGVALPARRGSRILKSATWIPGGCICSRTGHA